MLAFKLAAILSLGATCALAQSSSSTTGLSPSAASAASSASAAAATASTQSKVTNVQGKFFNNFYQIWLENTDYDKAAGNSDFTYLATQGILLTNYYAVTHPSEPNYVASVGGDYFGIGDDNFRAIPSPVASVVDLLEAAGISWGEYEEDMPYTGFQGFNYTDPVNDYVEYVRKHNPLIMYNTVATVPERLANIKNFTLFNSDLAGSTLPQWAFFTPNMQDDGHDTTVDYAGNWTRTFVSPLLNNTTFMNKTLLVITFDENETYTIKNNVWTLLLGDVIPPSMRGTTDNTFYTHYSLLSTIQNNWGLYHLGRGDVSGNYSNVFQIVANATGYQNTAVDPNAIPYFNFTASGYFDTSDEAPIPAVNTTPLGAGGMGILPSLKGANGSAIQPPTSSSSGASAPSGSSSTTGTASAAASSKSAANTQITFSTGSVVGMAFALLAFAVGLVV